MDYKFPAFIYIFAWTLVLGQLEKLNINKIHEKENNHSNIKKNLIQDYNV